MRPEASLHQYADSRIATTLDGGGRVALEVATGYPHHGSITVRIAEADGCPWALTLRVPAWAAAAEVTDPVGRRTVRPGTVVVERPFVVGDEVTLNLPMRPRWTAPDPRIDAVRGCAAVERGPLVCVESVDLPDRRHVDVLEVDPAVSPREVDGHVVVEGRPHTT